MLGGWEMSSTKCSEVGKCQVNIKCWAIGKRQVNTKCWVVGKSQVMSMRKEYKTGKGKATRYFALSFTRKYVDHLQMFCLMNCAREFQEVDSPVHIIKVAKNHAEDS